MVDTKAFRNLSYGLYIISSKKDGKSVGCVVNTFSQVTSTPAQVTVAPRSNVIILPCLASVPPEFWSYLLAKNLKIAWMP